MVSARRRGARQRELGQNFLVDRNIVELIERLAALGPRDVVLEIGGGPGVLSERLAQRAGHVHVVEVDPQLEGRLREAVRPFENVIVHIADALELDLASLHPEPNALVANLPYGIAATVILRTIEELPAVRRWLVMVQREVGERLAAAPGSRRYGAPSVLAQLACEVRLVRSISRTVFRPVPHVDSVLLELRRTGPAPGPGVQRLIHAAFAHRRKALAGSLALADGAPRGIRDRARAALEQLGHTPDERAERLEPAEFVELYRRLCP
jgi:16S rRNA (adenine1518-N6/adenine1519-N6)-dimethyltransferase